MIPAWNEAASIGAVLAEVPAHVVDWVFVVTRGNADATADIAASYGAAVLTQAEPGYGAACWEGACAAMAQGADVVAFLDGDYSDPPTDLPRVLQPLLTQAADLVLGWRVFAGHPSALPAHARLGNLLVVAALRRLLGQPLHDLPSCKAIRAECLRQLGMREMTYGWTVEMVVKSARASLRIAEVPVAYRPRLAGRSKVSGTIGGTMRAAWSLWSCALRYAAWKPSEACLPTAGVAG